MGDSLSYLILSCEGLTLEMSAFQSLYGGQFTLSTPLINQIFVFPNISISIGLGIGLLRH